jgi:hypothetical protein
MSELLDDRGVAYEDADASDVTVLGSVALEDIEKVPVETDDTDGATLDDNTPVLDEVRVTRAVADAKSVAAVETLTFELALDKALGAADAETRVVNVIAGVPEVVPEMCGEFVAAEVGCADTDVVRVAFADCVLVDEELTLRDAAAEMEA